MPFYAKPSGGYTISSNEGTNNIFQVYDYLAPLGYTKECIAGMLGNIYAESGLNPWRWQRDEVDLTAYDKGYGLMQFTPAYEYINRCTGITGYGPNLSTSQITSGASVDDGLAQLYVFDHDVLRKWSSACWRSYWSSTDYPELYTLSQNILLEYGTNSRLSMDQFKTIDIITYSTFAFLACYEGPTVPNFNTRYSYAQQIYDILVPYGGRDNLLVTLKILDTQQKRKFNNI